MGHTCDAPVTARVSVQDKTRQDKTSVLTSLIQIQIRNAGAQGETKTEPQTAHETDLDLELKET